jgi:hypothetical protein
MTNPAEYLESEQESTTFMRCYECSREYRRDDMVYDCDESYFCQPCWNVLTKETP